MFAPAGHFSYRQMGSMREVLGKVGTWDLVRLHCGEQLKGDYHGCQYIALNRQETDTLAFSRPKSLSSNTLWALLGHAPQVSRFQKYAIISILYSTSRGQQHYTAHDTIVLETQQNAAKMH